MTSKAGHFAAKALGIKFRPKDPYDSYPDLEGPGGSINSADTFIEEPPHVGEFFLGFIPTGEQVYKYFLSLFPFLSWIGYYNLQWLIGDLVAGKKTSPPEPGRPRQMLTIPQVSPSVPLLFRREWPTPSLLTSRFSLVSTQALWEFCFIGFSPPQKTSLSA